MSDWIDELTALLFASSFMTLATADDGGSPWASPVEFACDEELAFFWTSHHAARHSRNLRANPRAAVSIYDSTQTAGVRANVQAIYVEGRVDELSDAERATVEPAIGRWIAWRDPSRVEREGTNRPPSDESPWRTYRLTPARLYALDPAGHPEIPGVRIWRKQIDLAQSFSHAYRARLG